MKCCGLSCFIALLFLIANLYTMLSINYNNTNIIEHSNIINSKIKFYKLLTSSQKNTYKKIIDERKSLYYRGYGIGLILSFIIIFIYKYVLDYSKKNKITIWTIVCMTGAITFTSNYLFYILSPKSTYMIKNLKNKKQINAWLEIYRTMQVKYHLGLVFGVIAIMIFAYANRC